MIIFNSNYLMKALEGVSDYTAIKFDPHKQHSVLEHVDCIVGQDLHNHGKYFFREG